MTTDLERLKAWMAENGHDTASLTAALAYRHGGIAKILRGRREIKNGFYMRFAAVFGDEVFRQVFGDKPKEGSRLLNRFPEQTLAQSVVGAEVQGGRLRPASTYKCHGCDNQAQQYHHESYAPADRLCVVPLCRSCHRLHHNGRKVLTLGVVPTAVGLIRIAIATA